MTDPTSASTSTDPEPTGAGALDRHVVLVGLPGAGKTSVGRRLAKELDRPFADADEQLELTAGHTIPRIFRERGEEAFRQLETEVLTDLLGRGSPIVIASGGGTIIHERNRVLMSEHAVVIWLRASAEFLVGRTDPTHRPLLAEDPLAAYARLESERTGLYDEVADAVVDIEPFHTLEDKPKRLVARHIVDLLGRRGAAVSGDGGYL
ncbi:MAG TPA: shikimate kinase [Acidimicrobiales bacterium]|nr:shikimate kinase [Acidimicrobiales bacterium]